MAKQRILLVDDHEVVRLGLKSLLDHHPQFDVVGEASTAREAIEMVGTTHPDVVVMDIRLPGTSGIEACEEITGRYPETKVIMLTSYADDEAVFASILAGAAGYLLKQTRGQALAEAIEAVVQGGSLLDPAVTQKVLERVRSLGGRRPDDSLASLSDQEQKILLLIAEGKTNKEIAEEIFLSDKTVKNYVSSILSKLNLRRRAEAAAFIARKGLGRDEPGKEE